VEVFQTRVDSCLTNHELFRSARDLSPKLGPADCARQSAEPSQANADQ